MEACEKSSGTELAAWALSHVGFLCDPADQVSGFLVLVFLGSVRR